MGMTNHRLAALSLVLLAILALQTGCKSQPAQAEPLPTADTATQPAAPVLTAPLLAFREESRPYRVTLGPRKGQTLTAALTDQGDGRWRYELENTREVFLIRNDADGTLVTRETDQEEKVEVLYEPALQMLPPEMTPGVPVTNEVKMTVRNLADGKVRDQGTCELTCEYIGTRVVSSLNGDVEAHVIRTTRRIKLNLAQVEVKIENAYLPDVGTIVERFWRDTRALGLFSVKTSEELQRVDW
jgi:hypothetical protein